MTLTDDILKVSITRKKLANRRTSLIIVDIHVAINQVNMVEILFIVNSVTVFAIGDIDFVIRNINFAIWDIDFVIRNIRAFVVRIWTLLIGIGTTTNTFRISFLIYIKMKTIVPISINYAVYAFI